MFYACRQMCQKEFKRKGSLAQHIKRVHKVNHSSAEANDQLSAELVVELLNVVKSKVCENLCFSKEIKSELTNHAVSQPNTDLQKELEKLYSAYTNGHDREEFYGRFYANIVVFEGAVLGFFSLSTITSVVPVPVSSPHADSSCSAKAGTSR